MATSKPSANADEVGLIVDGRRYAGWKSVRVTQSIESLSGSFALEVSDRWDGSKEPWPIVEEDPCRIEIGRISVSGFELGEPVIDGYIDRRAMSADATSRSLSYSGRDRAAALVDCSALLTDGWSRRKVDVAEFVRELAAPFGIRVSVQPGLTFANVPKVSVSPGDGAFEVIRRVAGDDGVLIVSDGAGGILLTRAGKERATSLVEGENILASSVEYDAADRFSVYLVASQTPGTDEAFGEDTLVLTGAVDEGVRRGHRVQILRPDHALDGAAARRYGDWQARIRAARAERVNVTVVGWRQPDSKLWAVNTLTRVKAPRLIGVDGDMLISQVEFSAGDGGHLTTLSLVRPDAFTPEPQKATVKKRPRPFGWPELRRGASFDPLLIANRAINGFGEVLAKLPRK